jgi:2-haloacid dehalogenase
MDAPYRSQRRQLLGLLSAAVLSVAGRKSRAVNRSGSRPAKLRAVTFDLFTIFDPRSVVAAAEAVVPAGRAKELCDAWRLRQFEYSWLRAAAGRYLDFRTVAEESLAYATKAARIALSADARRTLLQAHERLEPWPDAPSTLLSMKKAGLRLAPLTNYSPSMLENVLAHAGLRPLFDELISTDGARTYKPDPRAYALGVNVLRLRREEICFAAFGGWDAAGAAWFGYPTFWVNRLGLPLEALAPGPEATGPTLRELAAWIAAR